MNKQRRKALEDLIERISGMTGVIDDIRQELEALRDEEQEFYDNMPESFQSGERGDRAQTAIDALDTAISELEEIDLDSIQSSINEAQEA